MPTFWNSEIGAIKFNAVMSKGGQPKIRIQAAPVFKAVSIRDIKKGQQVYDWKDKLILTAVEVDTLSRWHLALRRYLFNGDASFLTEKIKVRNKSTGKEMEFSANDKIKDRDKGNFKSGIHSKIKMSLYGVETDRGLSVYLYVSSYNSKDDMYKVSLPLSITQMNELYTYIDGFLGYASVLADINESVAYKNSGSDSGKSYSNTTNSTKKSEESNPTKSKESYSNKVPDESFDETDVEDIDDFL